MCVCVKRPHLSQTTYLAAEPAVVLSHRQRDLDGVAPGARVDTLGTCPVLRHPTRGLPVRPGACHQHGLAALWPTGRPADLPTR